MELLQADTIDLDRSSLVQIDGGVGWYSVGSQAQSTWALKLTVDGVEVWSGSGKALTSGVTFIQEVNCEAGSRLIEMHGEFSGVALIDMNLSAQVKETL